MNAHKATRKGGRGLTAVFFKNNLFLCSRSLNKKVIICHELVHNFVFVGTSEGQADSLLREVDSL